MPREKVEYRTDEEEIYYDDNHWAIFKKKRREAMEFIKPLEEAGIPFLIYGSIARGDVHKGSDIDVLIPVPISSYRIELIYDTSGISLIGKEIIQATPGDVIKGHFIFSNDITITSFLSPLGRLTLDFYKFSGHISSIELKNAIRVPGINKKLVLIIPTERGHKEISVLGNEYKAADILRVNSAIIESRKRILTRRDKVGRTGVYLKRALNPDDNMEMVLKQIQDSNPIIKRKMRKR